MRYNTLLLKTSMRRVMHGAYIFTEAVTIVDRTNGNGLPSYDFFIFTSCRVCIAHTHFFVPNMSLRNSLQRKDHVKLSTPVVIRHFIAIAILSREIICQRCRVACCIKVRWYGEEDASNVMITAWFIHLFIK